MAILSVQDLTAEDGGAIAFVAASVAGDKYAWDTRALIVVKNDDAAAKQVTVAAALVNIADPRYGDLTRSNIVLSVAPGAVAVIPPPPAPFRNSADANQVAITYDAVTSLSVAVVRVQ